jgi:hypothetical protein
MFHLRQQIVHYPMYKHTSYNLTETLNISGVIKTTPSRRPCSHTYKYRIDFFALRTFASRNRSKHDRDSSVLRDEESEKYSNGGVTRVVVIRYRSRRYSDMNGEGSVYTTEAVGPEYVKEENDLVLGRAASSINTKSLNFSRLGSEVTLKRDSTKSRSL